MKINKQSGFIQVFKPFIPYGVLEPWDDLNPRLFHAVHIYWLKFYGLWFIEDSWKSCLFWIRVLYAVGVLFLVCFLPETGEVLYMYKNRNDIGDVAEGLYLLLSETYTFFKLLAFWINKHKVFALLQHLYCEEFRPREEEHRDILRKSMITSRFIVTGYISLCLGAITVAIIVPIAENFEILPTNTEYIIFDINESPIYEVMYLQHIYYKPAVCIIDGVMDTILASFIITALGQIEILSFNLEKVGMLAERRRGRAAPGAAMPREYYVRQVLRECIIHHNCIIRYVGMIEDAFSLASALQLMLSAMVLCLIGVQFLSIENPSSHPMQMMWMGFYLSCMLTEVFICCWFGNELILKSTQLRQAAYNSDWVNMEEGSKVYLKIFVERCQRPLKVTAGKIFTLSLETYTVLINWAYKAFAVMRNMKK